MSKINQDDCAYMKDNRFICGCEREALMKIFRNSSDAIMCKWIKHAAPNANDISLRQVLRVCALCSLDMMLREVAIYFLRENLEKISEELEQTFWSSYLNSDYDMYHLAGEIVDTF